VSTAATTTDAHARPTFGADVRAVTLTVLAGAAAGALAGAIVGGLGGRLVMLILRLTSDPIVIGVTSDDGFEIGRVTLGGTIGLVGGLAALGAANGALYTVLRGSIPPRLRAALWALFAGAVGGSQFVHADGVDFTLLEPLWLAVVAFVVLPGLAALVVVLLVERWIGEPDRRPRPAALAVGAALGTVGLGFVAVLGAASIVVRRLGLAGPLGRLGRAVVPGALVVGIAVGGWYVVAEAVQILG
jgi:hypothetical protein